jgi:hypothetical protein
MPRQINHLGQQHEKRICPYSPVNSTGSREEILKSRIKASAPHSCHQIRNYYSL